MNVERMSPPLYNLQNIFRTYRNTVFECAREEEWEQQ